MNWRDLSRLPHATRAALVVGLGLAIAAAVVALRGSSYLPFFADDSFISLRYAQRFFHGQGLTWTDGERVEGYSNLLWVLVVGFFGRLSGERYVGAARVVGIASVAIAAASLLAFRGHRRRAWLGGALAAAVIVQAPAVAVWSVGGLEQPLALALLAFALGAATHETVAGASLFPMARPVRRAAAVAFALLCLTRPDGILLAALTSAVLLAVALAAPPRRERVRDVVALALPSLATWLGQLLFRLAYYRDWVPNTAYAKVAFTPNRLREGLDYVAAGVRSMPLLGVSAGLGLALLFTPRRPRAAPLLLVHLGWAAYVAVIGGDIFPAYRHLLPLLVTSALLLREAWLFALSQGGRMAVLGGVGLAAVVVVGCWSAERRDPEIARGHEERWEWEAEPVGGFLKRAYGAKKPLMAVDAAGALPYFAETPALDMLGLNDRYMAHHRPADFGHGPLAHELGDGAYVLDRRPDLILFCLPWGNVAPCTRSDRELVALPAFHELYALTEIEAVDPHVRRAQIWTRRDGALGVVRTSSAVRVPALLFTREGGEPARLGADASVELVLSPGTNARYDRLDLPGGRWHLNVEGADTSAIIARVQGPEGAASSEGTTLALEGPASVAVVLEVGSGAPGAARFSSVSLTREAPQGP